LSRATGLRRIVSGGQTGVDRAALDAALQHGFPCGGWCPRGRWAEDGPIPNRYPLREADSADPAWRTEANVRDSDATAIIADGPLTGGTRLTDELARRLGRPVCLVDTSDTDIDRMVDQLTDFLAEHAVAVLNVAGPRRSQAPAMEDLAGGIIGGLLERLGQVDSRKLEVSAASDSMGAEQDVPRQR